MLAKLKITNNIFILKLSIMIEALESLVKKPTNKDLYLYKFNYSHERCLKNAIY